MEAEPRSGSAARRFVTGALDEWSLERFDEDAAICAAELASNAILHSRRPFTIAARPINEGLRIDVQDERPDRLPLTIPASLSPLDTSTTGRGLKLVANLASRWGYFTTDTAKTVWVELADWQPDTPISPIVELAQPPARRAAPTFEIIGLPVAAALASGIEVDDMVRQVQLHADELDAAQRAAFYEALEGSAAPRLKGRQEALRAAGAGEKTYNFQLSLSEEEYQATLDLTLHLASLARRLSIPLAVPAEVSEMRAWLAKEIDAQRSGQPPSTYPD